MRLGWTGGLVRAALLGAGIGAAATPASADLEWFDAVAAGSRGVLLAEIVAASDAVLELDAESLLAVADLHARYAARCAEAWANSVGVRGEGRLLAEERVASLRGPFLEALREQLEAKLALKSAAKREVKFEAGLEVEFEAGLEARSLASATVALLAALDDVRAAFGARDRAFAEVRRAVLALAAEHRDASVLATLAEALAACRRADGQGPMPIALALEPLGSRLAEAIGDGAAEEFRILLSRAVERPRDARLLARLALIVRNASTLAAGDRSRLLASVERAAAGRRARLLAPAQAIADAHAPARDEVEAALGGAEDAPANGGARRMTPAERTWRRGEARDEGTMAAAFAEVLGAERANLLLQLVRGDFHDPDGGESNDAADAALLALVGAEGFARLVAGDEGPFWRPVEIMGSIEEQSDLLRILGPWTMELLSSMLASPPDESESAVLEVLLEDHRARRREILANLAPGAFADALLDEGTRVLEDLRAALPDARLSERGVALVRLASVESGAALGALGGLLLETGDWLQGDPPAGSLALLALGAPQRFAPPLPSAARVALAEALAPDADAMREAWLDDLRRFRAHAALSSARAAELRSSHQRLAMEMSRRRAAGEEIAREELDAYGGILAEASAEEARIAWSTVPVRESILLSAWSRVLRVVERLEAKARDGGESSDGASDENAALAARVVTAAACTPFGRAGDAGLRLGEALGGIDDDALVRRVARAYSDWIDDPVTPLVEEIARCRALQSADRLLERGETEPLARVARERIAGSILASERALAGATRAWIMLRDAGHPAAREAFRP
ncbi:MAG: hypothetical protein RI967_100 [Planctomycetota bacterium]